jgi:putative flippase GtrA
MKEKILILINKLLNTSIISFAIIAGLSMVFELSFYTLLFEILKVDKVVSSPIAQAVSMVFNFSLNKIFTFKTGKEFNLKEVVGYLGVWLVNLTVTTILMGILTQVTQIYPTIIRFAIMVLMFFFNFFALKIFVFKEKKNE